MQKSTFQNVAPLNLWGCGGPNSLNDAGHVLKSDCRIGDSKICGVGTGCGIKYAGTRAKSLVSVARFSPFLPRDARA